MEKKKVAIACQGGGSQTAFTAGVLSGFIEQEAFDQYELVSISGTSGGAVCASLLWYSMLQARASQSSLSDERLVGFWQDNASQNVFERALNDSTVALARMVGRGKLPEFHLGPMHPLNQMTMATLQMFFPRFYDLQGLLEKHIDFEQIPSLPTADSPLLVIGAANVKTGEYRKFTSRSAATGSAATGNDISVEAIMASAAVPSLFPAVKVDGEYYWDGLFSDNPPTDELILNADHKPDELWVIQINPTQRASIPVTPEDIQDRRNEMIGNNSLFQDLNHILQMNQFVAEGAFTEAYQQQHDLKVIDIFQVDMSEGLMSSLDYPSKLNRNAAYINRLMDDGRQRAREFLSNKEVMRYQKQG